MFRKLFSDDTAPVRDIVIADVSGHTLFIPRYLKAYLTCTLLQVHVHVEKLDIQIHTTCWRLVAHDKKRSARNLTPAATTMSTRQT